ncbi:hypothetical protein QM858_03835 [Streptococcus infantis]|uniref:hypothetical protein n=1 Tax=Streptococcus infantis TaxID=68892 RepID=UPI0039C1B49E
MISLLFDSSFLFIVLALGAIMYIIAKQGKPEQSLYLEFLLLTILTTCVFLFDNPLRPNPYAGLLFYVFDFYIFTSASLAFSLTAIYKSTRHLRYYPSSYSKLLKINAWFLAILSGMNLLFIMLAQEMGIILLLPIFGISFIIQFLVGELERKRVQKLLKQINEDAVIQNLEATEDEPHEN